MSKNLGILGCGWLGMPLAKKCVEKGYTVKGTTTSIEKLEKLRSVGILPYHIGIKEGSIHGDVSHFMDSLDTLIINIPPKLRKTHSENYVDKMHLLLEPIASAAIKNLLFVSSTSVYGAAQGEVTEDTIPKPITESGKQLLQSETLFFNDKAFNCTIVRFGGLIGPDRHPITYLSGKNDLDNGNELVNLIHLEDGIHMIMTIIQNNYWNEIFNGVYPYHPTKKEYYTAEALKRDLPPPVYRLISKEISHKTILSTNFIVKNHGFHTTIVS